MRPSLVLPLLMLCGTGPVNRPECAGQHESGGVRFNEVLANAPGPEGDGGGEWIELRNDGDHAVDLAGWAVGDVYDPIDLIMPWHTGGPTLLGPTGLALILDPDADPASLALPPGVLVLKPDDTSLGNGLRAAGEQLVLIDPGGTLADSVTWESDAGDGISWERQVSDSGLISWSPCRAPAGSTPGRENSLAPVPHRPLSRVITEVQPRPLEGWCEWLECAAADTVGESTTGPEATWLGWIVTVRSLASPGSSGRRKVIGERTGRMLLVASDQTVRIPSQSSSHEAPIDPLVWPGLRIADGGSVITLTDPSGTVVDSAVIRPVTGLPRGFSWQRWRPDLPGWSPDAWGIGRSTEDVTPGWVGTIQNPAESTDQFRFWTSHHPDGQITLEWISPVDRLRIRARLFDMSGREMSTIIRGIMVPGAGHQIWNPGSGSDRVEPGIYLLVVEAFDEDSSRKWVVRRAVGVRP